MSEQISSNPRGYHGEMRRKHREAMALVDAGTTETLAQALALETEVAWSCQPSSLGRAVFFRSAATIALRLGDKEKAQSLARDGLHDCPYPQIREELEAVISQCAAGGT